MTRLCLRFYRLLLILECPCPLLFHFPDKGFLFSPLDHHLAICLPLVSLEKIKSSGDLLEDILQHLFIDPEVLIVMTVRVKIFASLEVGPPKLRDIRVHIHIEELEKVHLPELAMESADSGARLGLEID